MVSLPGPPEARNAWDGFLHPRVGDDPRRRAAEVGSWLVDDDALAALDEAWDGVPVTVEVAGGAGAIGPALTWAARSPATVTGVALTLRDEMDPAGNVRRVVAALDQARADGVADDGLAVAVRLPPVASRGGDLPPSWTAALDELSMADLALVLRDDDGAAGVPLLHAALDRELTLWVRDSSPAGDRWPPVVRAVLADLEGEDPRAAWADATAETSGTFSATEVERVRRWVRGVHLTDAG